MKTHIFKFSAILIFALANQLISTSSFAQAPEKFNYQTVVRDNSGNILANHPVSFRISLLQDSVYGSAVYVETHNDTTNAYGLSVLKIGGGSPLSGSMAGINWADGPYYLKVELDQNGGTLFTTMGVTQLISVPYALHSGTADSVSGTYPETDPVFGVSVAGGITATDTTFWNNKLDNEIDGSVTNELQVLSMGHDTIYLSDGGFVSIASYSDTLWKKSGNNIFNTNSGNVGIGTTSPAALLHTSGAGTGGGNVLFEGEFKLSDPGETPVSGEGTRMMWYPDKAAFRAGYVDNAQWDKDSIGYFSFAVGIDTRAKNFSSAFGNNTCASGMASIAMGYNSTASGFSSTAMGNFTIASGYLSTALGDDTRASGSRSTAMGHLTTASGDFSTAMGAYTTALSEGEMVIGHFNTLYTPASTAYWINSDRLFVIGNGTDYSARSNAMTVLKNGKVGIGTSNPAALLHASDTGTGGGNVLFDGVLKLSNPGEPPVSGAGTRMMWYPDKGAFRAGTVIGPNWDKDSIGYLSFAAGFDTRAKDYSTALGYATTATGVVSTAMGFATTAYGDYSMAFGSYAFAWGDHSTAMGYQTIASGHITTALGDHTVAYGERSTAMGYNTYASGLTSTAIGHGTIASGDYSAAMGISTAAPSFCETVIGLYNSPYTPASMTGWNNNDRLFVIGNGSNDDTRSNAVTVLKSGNVGIGTSSPVALLHTSGTGTGGGNVLFDGVLKSLNPVEPPVSGAGTRMMWYPDKAAFRAGKVNGTNWDKDSIGYFSFAAGINTKAKGSYSMAMGYDARATGAASIAMGGSKASGDYSTAMGFNTTASGNYSTAMGDLTTATGGGSTAMGLNSVASGTYSTAMGLYTTAPSYGETVIGSYNTQYTPASSLEWNSGDRLFVIGNGTGAGDRSNAVTVFKSGKVGIGTSTPENKLHVVTSNPVVAIKGHSTGNNGVGVWGEATGVLYNNIGVYGNATGSASMNIGVYGSASGATSNWAGYFETGNVHITNMMRIGASASIDSHKLAAYGSTGGVDGATVHIQNSASNGISALIENTSASSSDVALLAVKQGGSGDIVRFDQGNPWNPRFRFTLDGNGLCDGSWSGGGADYAEYFPVADPGIAYEPGDVIIISDKTSYSVESSSQPYSNLILGVYSSNPAFIGNSNINDNNGNKILVGMMGVISTKVCNETGSIAIGDYVTTSSVTGVAMKAVKSGYVIGRALEAYNDGTLGYIKVLVDPGWAQINNSEITGKSENELQTVIQNQQKQIDDLNRKYEELLKLFDYSANK
ncbi:MAG TPA: hypothetical protein PKW80_03565 [Bacteroidales bacterium]|nr:hypothetical protein [Bacteroidales bacterium]